MLVTEKNEILNLYRKTHYISYTLLNEGVQGMNIGLLRDR